MAVVIRMSHVGTLKKPGQRIVVTDKRFPRDGRFLEIIGFYHPARKDKPCVIKADRARHWLSKGAKPSATVHSLFKKKKVYSDQ